MAPIYKPGHRLLGRFEIREFVGSGGVGEVYRALEGEETVALKVLAPGVVPGYIRTEKIREVLFGQLPAEDPVVLPREVVEDGSNRFILSKFISGKDLRRILDEQKEAGAPFDLPRVLEFINRLLGQLALLPPFAWHGALKPGNIILEGVEGGLEPSAKIRITDIHFPRIISFSKYASIQLSRGVAYNYLAPEFVSLGGRVDQRADLYSVGVLAFEMLTGSVPGRGIVSLSEAGWEGPADVDEVIAKALSPLPEKRFSGFSDFQGALRAASADLREALDGAPVRLVNIDMFTGREEQRVELDAGQFEKFDIFAEPEEAEAPGEPPVDKPDLDGMETAFDQALATGETVLIPESPEEGIEEPLKKVDAFAARPEQPIPGDAAAKWIYIILGAAAVILVVFALPYFRGGAKKPAKVPQVITPASVPAMPAPVTPEAATTTTTTSTTTTTLAPQQAEIALLLAQAKEQMAKERYVSPPKPDNALDKVEKIEALDPENPFPAQARGKMVDDYTSWTKGAMSDQDWSKAGKFAKNGLVVDPDNAALKQLLDEIEKLAAAAGVPTPQAPVPGPCPAEMVYVSAGTFRLGSAPDDPMRQAGEPANLNIYLPAYCVDRYEFPNKSGVVPKAVVSLTEAKAACMNVGKYLCSEKEWEKACKGGSKNRRFPYGNEYNDAACSTQSEAGKNRGVSTAGSWAGCRSAYGVHDMSGNVQEWTSTPVAPGAPSFVIKGGDGYHPGWEARCANREAAAPGTTRSRLGFRCCKKPAA